MSTGATAAPVPVRTYGEADGLINLDGACLVQDRAGYLWVCSEHGVFVYDGRRFTNLGHEQGLRDGGKVLGLILVPTGRVIVTYGSGIAVSDQSVTQVPSPVHLHFSSVIGFDNSFFNFRPRQVAAWREGAAVIINGAIERLAIAATGSGSLEPIGFSPDEQRQLRGVRYLFSVGARLWAAFDDRLCTAEPGAVRCYGAADGLQGGPWFNIVQRPDGTLLARSRDAVARLDRTSSRWVVAKLPDQGPQYDPYLFYLGFFQTPNGSLLTQSAHGLDILERGRWLQITNSEGAPPGIIMGSLTDATGQVWFEVLGRGLARWIGYGHWDTLTKAAGLADSVPWEMDNAQQGTIWVATDASVTQILSQEGELRAGRSFAMRSYALTTDKQGDLWATSGQTGVTRVDPSSGHTVYAQAPATNAIRQTSDGRLWLGTEAGLYFTDRPDAADPQFSAAGTAARPVSDVVDDGFGGVFYILQTELRHRLRDGQDKVLVGGQWPATGFQPLALAIDKQKRIWVGGNGGLFRCSLSDNGIAQIVAVPTQATRTNNIVDVLVDHRGWVWVGTGLGISVYNQKRWVSINTDSGLLADDVSERGLHEGTDGSVWISTSQGIAHLLDPSWLFETSPVRVVISLAELGGRFVSEKDMPYTTDPLSLELGTPNYAAERSVVFRYRFSGVDTGWATSSTGSVRYPFVPPGRHVFSVVAYDEMTHQTSSPVTLAVDVAYPWWRQWWAEAVWAVLATAGVYLLLRLWSLSMKRRQAELERRVAEATEDMRAAQAQLRFQAAHDMLTGLLNRSEIERRLAETLSFVHATGEIVVALLDIDHFKQVNDLHGHLGGDAVLRVIGRLVTCMLREGELAGRYGGEEILLLLDDADGRGAERILDLHAGIRREEVGHRRGVISVTCSIGLAWAEPGDDWESLVGRADAALYEAKETGRDRIVESRMGQAVNRGTARTYLPPP